MECRMPPMTSSSPEQREVDGRSPSDPTCGARAHVITWSEISKIQEKARQVAEKRRRQLGATAQGRRFTFYSATPAA